MQTGRGGQRPAQRPNGLGREIGGIDLGDLGQPEGEGADAAEEVGDADGAGRLAGHEGGHGGFGLRGGLEEGSGRHGDHCRSQAHLRQARLVGDLAIEGDAREVGLGRPLGQLDAGVGRETAGFPLHAGDVDIETARGQRHMQGGRGLRMLEKRRRQPLQGRDRRLDRRVGDRADGDVHQIPGLARLVTEPGGLAAAAAGVQRHAPPASRLGGERRQDLGLDLLAGQGSGEAAHLPGEIGLARPVLQGAAAAGPEMRAGRGDALGARFEHLHQLAPLAAAYRQHALTRQGEGHEGRSGGHAIALAADRLDGQLDRRAGRTRGAALVGPCGAVSARGRLHGWNSVLVRER